MLAELKRLRRDTDASRHAVPAASASAGTRARRSLRPYLAGSGVLAALFVIIWLWPASELGQPARATQISVAVLPFANVGVGSEHDFLRLGLADEVATALSHAPALAVRPLTVTRRYADAATVALAAGKELQVEHVVTGQFAREGGQIRVSLEAIEVAGQRLVWRASVTAPIDDSIAVRRDVAERLRTGLLPEFGVTLTTDTATAPTNPEAYSLYLRAVAY